MLVPHPFTMKRSSPHPRFLSITKRSELYSRIEKHHMFVHFWLYSQLNVLLFQETVLSSLPSEDIEIFTGKLEGKNHLRNLVADRNKIFY
jgi:hypothetical protein